MEPHCVSDFKQAFGSSRGGLPVGEAGSAQSPHRPEVEPNTASAHGQPDPDLPGLQ